MSDAAKKVTMDNSASEQMQKRELPQQMQIPRINGEMVSLRPATIADLAKMDDLQAFYNSTGITGKGYQAERTLVNAWVRRSVAWSTGQASEELGISDSESRSTIAWAMISLPDQSEAQTKAAGSAEELIGMIFLIDIDSWSRSARIQVVLGKNYRGRGYSRDAMPRVMTYGFADQPTGLGLHRIWVAVPEKNARSISVYQSLGFMISGTARDALWDADADKYQDQIVMDSLADEYDPEQSLEAFGMHVIEDNPGVVKVHEASKSEEISRHTQHAPVNSPIFADEFVVGQSHSQSSVGTMQKNQDSSMNVKGLGTDKRLSDNLQHAVTSQSNDASNDDEISESCADTESEDNATTWAYSDSNQKKASKGAWWRNLGRSMKGNTGGKS